MYDVRGRRNRRAHRFLILVGSSALIIATFRFKKQINLARYPMIRSTHNYRQVLWMTSGEQVVSHAAFFFPSVKVVLGGLGFAPPRSKYQRQQRRWRLMLATKLEDAREARDFVWGFITFQSRKVWRRTVKWVAKTVEGLIYE